MTTSASAPFPGRTPSPRPWKKWLGRGALGVAGASLSAVLICTAFFKVSLADGALRMAPRFTIGEWIHDLPHHLPWVAAYAALVASVIPLRALQWRFTLRPGGPGFVPRYHAVAIGAFFHNAVPGKLGEFVRAFLLARRHRIAFFESLGSVLLCKLLEFAALVAVVAVSLVGPLGGEFSGRLGPALGIAAVALVALASLSMAAARWAVPLGQRLQRRGRLPRFSKALANLGQGLHAVRSPRRAALALVASVGPVAASALAYGVALQALGVKLGIFSGAVVLGAVSLGQLTPGLPIGMGMYYLTTSWAARSLGATPAQAAAFAMLTHVATVASQLLVGLASLASQGLRPRELLREREAFVAQQGALAPVEAGPLAATGTE